MHPRNTPASRLGVHFNPGSLAFAHRACLHIKFIHKCFHGCRWRTAASGLPASGICRSGYGNGAGQLAGACSIRLLARGGAAPACLGRVGHPHRQFLRRLLSGGEGAGTGHPLLCRGHLDRRSSGRLLRRRGLQHPSRLPRSPLRRLLQAPTGDLRRGSVPLLRRKHRPSSHRRPAHLRGSAS